MWLIKIFICEEWSICQLARNIEIYLSIQVGAHEAAETQAFFPNTVAKSLEVCDPWGLGMSGWLRQWWLTLLWESQSLGLESKDCGCQGSGQSVKNLVGKRSVIFPKARGNSLEESQVWVIGKEHYISDCSSVNTVGARVEWQFTACVRKQYSVGEGGVRMGMGEFLGPVGEKHNLGIFHDRRPTFQIAKATVPEERVLLLSFLLFSSSQGAISRHGRGEGVVGKWETNCHPPC